MIGAIADDFTGGTDVAVAFRRAGLRTVVLFGLPDERTPLPDADAVVVALKTRTVPAHDAVAQSSAAARWLQQHGAQQLFFKYCSTFDSTPAGNIGPVADALADLSGADVAVVAPSALEHGRTVYKGHLFVHSSLLSESPMRNHPLTPMTDSSVPRLLETQTERAVRLVDLEVVRSGPHAVRAALDEAARAGARYAVVDAIEDDDLTSIGKAIVDAPLITGAAGLAGGLGRARAAQGGLVAERGAEDPVGAVRSIALAGSCSARTLEQIEVIQRDEPSFRLDAVATPDAQTLADAALAWYDAQDPSSSPLIYSSLPPEELRRTQQQLGTERASEILEGAMGIVAQGLVARGVRRVVVAGGETSGAVVSALEVAGGLIGTEAAPGVPWIYTTDDEPVALLLKSGNFGEPDLLATAVHAGRGERTLA